MEYNVDFFIRKFEAIPEEKWCTEDYEDKTGNHCAYGHCGINVANCRETDSMPEARSLKQIFEAACLEVVDVNDGGNMNYDQQSPKARMLAALNDIKKMQDGQAIPVAEQPPVKVITKYVGVPETLTEQTSKLILS